MVERFVRLEASRHSPGTGLGLSLVAAVAHFHNAAAAAGRQCARPEGDIALPPSGARASRLLRRMPTAVPQSAVLTRCRIA